MKKWEYKAGAALGEGDALVKELGAEGWEAYAVISNSEPQPGEGYSPSSHICTFFFKRELIDSKQVIL